MGSKKHDDNNVMGGGGGGPCGACRFLRRKCVKGCIFAPHFDSNNLGTSHFAAVHKVFGASNVSKLLLGIPPHKRQDAVVSLCYEALSRVTDPVYGCVSHIFNLQQQVVNLRGELAYIEARLSMLRRPPLPPPPPPPLQASSDLQASDSTISTLFDPSPSDHTSFDMSSICNPREEKLENEEDEEEDDDLQRLAQELVAKYLPGIRFQPLS